MNKPITPLFRISLALLLLGCGKQDLSIQENPAMHNHLIESSRIFPEAAKLDFITAKPAEDGAFFYLANKRSDLPGFYPELFTVSNAPPPVASDFELGKMDAGGQILWNTTLSFFPQDIELFPSPAVSESKLLIAGSKNRKAVIAIYDPASQTLLKEMVLDQGNSSLQSIARSSGNTFFVAGLADNFIPYLLEIQVDPINNDISILMEKKYLELRGFVSDLNIFEDGQGNLVFYLAQIDNGTGHLIFLNRDFEITGNRYLPIGLKIGSGFVFPIGDKLFCIGDSPDSDKAVNSSGASWASGLIYCYDKSGNRLWEKKTAPSKYSDLLSGLVANGDILFLVGTHSYYCTGDAEGNVDRCYSNGLLVKMNAATGAVLSTYTFSHDSEPWNRSWFSGGVISGGYLHLWGNANLQEEKDSDGWIITCNLSEL